MRHRSTSTSPDPTPAIDAILQYGQSTGTSIPVYHGAVNSLKVIAAWGAFALFHSVTVSEPYERWARRVMGEDRFRAYHRLLFTLYSAAATAAVLLYVRSLPDIPRYRIDGWVRLLFHGVQFLGAGLLLWTPWDLKEFIGLRQWERHRKKEEDAQGRNEGLFTGKGYGLVRHPLYLGCSLLLAFHPDQTRAVRPRRRPSSPTSTSGRFSRSAAWCARSASVPGVPAPRPALPAASAPRRSMTVGRGRRRGEMDDRGTARNRRRRETAR